MAAFPLCASSWFAPAAVAAAASHGARITSTAVHVHPLCRRGTSPAPVRIQDRTRVPFHSRCHRRPMREPEPESDDDVLYLDQLDLRASIDNPFPTEDEEQRKKYAEFCASMGWREPPDMFPIERDEISNYMIKTASSRANDQDVNNKVMALVVCAEAQKALDLASRVMDLMNMARLNIGTPEISQDTINQTVRTYVAVFLNVAKDAYNKRIERETVLSFLDALRGLGAICHILVQDTVAMMKDADREDFINNYIATHSLKFEKRMNILKEELLASTEATGIKHTLAMGMLFDGMKRAQVYIVKLIQARREALDYLSLAQVASSYKASRKKDC